MATVFLFIRYSLQISRLCRLIIDSKKHLDIEHEQKINLSDVDE